MTDQTVILKSGTAVHRAVVLTTMTALRHLMDSGDFLTVVDAVEWARTRTPQSYSAGRLEAIGLTQGGVMHRDVASVIASAALGKDFNLTIGNPLSGRADD